jgi:hypothetical protein
MPEAAWTPALDADGRGRDGAWVFATDQPGRDLARLTFMRPRLGSAVAGRLGGLAHPD